MSDWKEEVESYLAHHPCLAMGHSSSSPISRITATVSQEFTLYQVLCGALEIHVFI